MIFLLHGENTATAYSRLSALCKHFADHKKVYVENKRVTDLESALASGDLFGTKKLIIAENFITKQKLKPQNLKEIEPSNVLVLWEKKELTRAQVSAFAKIVTVEEFKLPPSLFNFLDSISVSASVAIKNLKKIDPNEKTSLTWHISNRLCLMILALENASEQTATKISGRYVASWQLAKAQNQARNMDYQKLKQLFAASLKIDYLTKTGATNIPQRSLIALMLIKYLPG